MRSFIALTFILGSTSTYADGLKEVPAKFVHDQIFVIAPTPDGKEITFFTDTGGGWNAISQSVVDRLKLSSMGSVEGENKKLALIEFPSFVVRAGIPKPNAEAWLRQGLVALPDKDITYEGFLGSRWFAGRVWEFDYPNKTLRVGASWRRAKNEIRIPLGFLRNEKGVRQLNFPRIDILVEGESLPMLLDTGATAKVTATSSQVLGLAEDTRQGTSYIIKTVFDKWHAGHPEWKVIENAESVTGLTFRMIEVPQVQIGTLKVGPVWFSERRDNDFHEYMSPNMDRRIDGAIGGSALKYFRFVIDYPNSVAYFQTPSGVIER